MKTPCTLVVLTALTSTVQVASAGEIVAVKVGRAITVSGDDIENATILIEAGRIKAIGKDVAVPAEARVIDRPESVAMPGIVDPHATTGLRDPNEVQANVPYVSVLDGVDPSAVGLEHAVRHGVTAVHCIAGNATRFGGQGAVIRTRGSFVDQMVVKSPSAMKISLSTTSSESRMGNMAAMRKSFYELFSRIRKLGEPKTEKASLITQDTVDGKKDATDAKKDAADAKKDAADGKKDAADAKEEPTDAKEDAGDAKEEPTDAKEDAGDAKEAVVRPALDALVNLRPTWADIDWSKIPEDKIAERDRPLVDLVRGKLRAHLYCPTATDVYKAFELIDTNGLDATLVLGNDAYKLAKVLAGREGLGPVIISSIFEIWEEDRETGAEKRHITPKALHDGGVEFVIQVRPATRSTRGASFSRRGDGYHWYQAARLVRYGIPRKKALETITLLPAKILGLDHRLGSLEVGKDADIAIFSGDPLDARSWVQEVLIEGRTVYDREKDADLELLLRSPERPF